MQIDLKITPKNLLADWGEFEDWENGDDAEPTGWSKTGTPTIAKESTIKKHGDYSVKLIGTDTGQDIHRAIDDGEDYQGRTITLGVWVYTSGAGVTITIDDGVGTTNSSAHTGGGGLELLSVTRQIDPSATKLQATLNIPNGVTAYFDSCLLVEGEVLYIDLNSNDYAMQMISNNVDVRADDYDIAREEGVLIPEMHVGRKTLRFSGDVSGSSLSNARANFDNLMKSLFRWKKSEKLELSFFDDRIKEVFLNKLSYDPESAGQLHKFDISFLAEKPTWRYISRLRKSQVIASSPTSFNLIYHGTFESKPIIYFIADQAVDISSCLLENMTTGESLTFTGTVTVGNTLKVDCDLKTVENNGVSSLAYFPGDFLKLVPGTNYLKFTGSLCTIKIDWFDRWI